MTCPRASFPSICSLLRPAHSGAVVDLMELSKSAIRSLPRRYRGFSPAARHDDLAAALVCSPMAIWSRRQFTSSSRRYLPGPPGLGMGGSSSPPTYFQRQTSLPANTIIRFVPQQTAWIVERMGKFNRILQPGLAILMPVIDVCVFLYLRVGIPELTVETAHRIRPISKRIGHRDSESKCHHRRQRHARAGWCAVYEGL